MDELTTYDYITKPFSVIRGHDSFSYKAFDKAAKIMDMTTTQLENLDISGVINGR